MTGKSHGTPPLRGGVPLNYFYLNIDEIVLTQYNLSDMKQNLQQKILIYIQFFLKEKSWKFEYDELRKILKNIDGREYSIKTLRKEFSILKSKDYIEHKLRYRRPYPVLTTEGKLKISSHLPYKKYDVWDGSWRVISANIPESDRKSRIYFQNELLKIGFKKVNRSTYISSHPLLASANRIATELGINQHCLMFESKKFLRQDLIVEKIWETSQIDKQYNNFIRLAKNKLQRQK